MQREEHSFGVIFGISGGYSELLWGADMAFKLQAGFNKGAVFEDIPRILIEDDLAVWWIQLPLTIRRETCKGYCYIKAVLVAENIFIVELAFKHSEQNVNILVFEPDDEFETSIAHSYYEDDKWTKWPHVWMYNFMIAVDCLPECFSEHVLAFNQVQETVAFDSFCFHKFYG